MAIINNAYYVKKVADIRTALPPPSKDPLSRLGSAMAGSTAPKFYLQPVHPDVVDKIIRKNSKTKGLDYNYTNTIKLVRNKLVPAITRIINTAVLPRCYKMSTIIPLLKCSQSDSMNPPPYCPVALLPVASKILERVVFVQVVKHMNKHSLFHQNHYGFRAHHSATTAILQMYDSWMEAIQKC